MLKGIKLKLYPNSKQSELFQILFENDRFVWNTLLDIMNKRYENNPEAKPLGNYALGYLIKPLTKEENHSTRINKLFK